MILRPKKFCSNRQSIKSYMHIDKGKKWHSTAAEEKEERGQWLFERCLL